MTPNKRIGAVARAICIGLGDDPDREGERITAYDAAAKAAILATLQSLLEPSAGMIEAGEHGWMNRNLRDPNSEPIGDSFRAMIQQAIKEME